MFGRYHKNLRPYFNEIKTAFDIASNELDQAKSFLRDESRSGYQQRGSDGSVISTVSEVAAKQHLRAHIRIHKNLAVALQKVAKKIESENKE